MTSSRSEPPARQRIAKLMSRVGLCSRRDAEAWIVDGRVSVNGETLTSPAIDVGPDDTILVDGAPLPTAEKTRLFLFHKPRGLVTSDHDPEGRATVAEFLREHWPDGPRVVTIGRLDINTEGLLLLTNDGGLARVLELPKTGWVRRYRVRAKGETDQAVLDSLRDGVTIDGVDYAGIEATLDRTQGANVWLTMALREGKNREVKRVLEHVGLEVNRLIRLSFGPFQLGDLAEGAVEEVRTRVLRDQLGAALAAAAGVAFEDAAPPPEPKRVAKDRKPRAAGAERVNKGERPARAEFRERERGERGPQTRGSDARGRDPRRSGGDRPLRRPRGSALPEPIRERPPAGTRKHVSTLRAEGTEAARHGPRRRIERADVTDRHDRPVKVERRVAAGPDAARLAPTRTRAGFKGRRDGEAAPGRGKASPSALAKRARTARSGGYGTERDDPAAPRRGASGGEGGPKTFADKRPRRDAADAGRPPRGDRPSGPRRDRDRSHADARPAEPRGERPAQRDDRSEARGRAAGGTRRTGRSSGDDRRREVGARPERSRGDEHDRNAPRGGAPGRGRPDSGRPRGGKRFEGERPGARSERAPRGEGRGAGKAAGRREDARGTGPRAHRPPRRREDPRSDGAPGGPRPGGGKPPSRPGGDRRGEPKGGPGRGKPRPRG